MRRALFTLLLLTFAGCLEEVPYEGLPFRCETDADCGGREGSCIAQRCRERAPQTFYLAPDGADANDGRTEERAWLTFGYATPQLRPGDTLVLLDGVYGPASLGGSSGEAALPITVRAKNERRALLRGNGVGPVLHIEGASHWRVEGLRIEARDNSQFEATGAEASNAVVVTGRDTSHIILRRLLVSKPNRWGQYHLVRLNGSDGLLEESELYDFHKVGVEVHGARNVLRRNYLHGRGANLDGAPKPDTSGLYNISDLGTDTLIENNVSEGGTYGVLVYGVRTRVLGNVLLENDTVGVGFIKSVSYSETRQVLATDGVAQDNVAVRPKSYGALMMSALRVEVQRLTVVGAANRGFTACNCRPAPPEDRPAFRVRNTLVVGGAGMGFEVRDPDTFDQRLFEFSHGFGNAGGDWGPGTEMRVASPPEPPGDVDPKVDPSGLFLLPGSPMRGAGEGGGDIGATVVDRIVNGVQTTEPLWDPATAAFPCGAKVEGINDVPGRSCFDVQLRLNLDPSRLPR